MFLLHLYFLLLSSNSSPIFYYNAPQIHRSPRHLEWSVSKQIWLWTTVGKTFVSGYLKITYKAFTILNSAKRSDPFYCLPFSLAFWTAGDVFLLDPCSYTSIYTVVGFSPLSYYSLAYSSHFPPSNPLNLADLTVVVSVQAFSLGKPLFFFLSTCFFKPGCLALSGNLVKNDWVK